MTNAKTITLINGSIVSADEPGIVSAGVGIFNDGTRKQFWRRASDALPPLYGFEPIGTDHLDRAPLRIHGVQLYGAEKRFKGRESRD